MDQSPELHLIANRGNLRLVGDSTRKFPGLLIQGDTLKSILDDISAECGEPGVCDPLRVIVDEYEAMMSEAGLKLPYF